MPVQTNTEILRDRATVAFLDHVAVTPSNTDDLAAPCRAIHVDVAGYVKFKNHNKNDVELYLAAGVTHHHCARRIYATTVGSPAATGITACY